MQISSGGKMIAKMVWMNEFMNLYIFLLAQKLLHGFRKPGISRMSHELK